MKIIRSLITLSMLLIFGTATIVDALPQQQPGTVPAEKKRAMNKFDPADLFPEAKDHDRKERTKRDKKSASLSILASSAPSGAEPSSTSRKNSRHRRTGEARSAKPETRLASNAVTAPPPPSPSLGTIQTQPVPTATTEQSPSPGAVMAGATALTTPPSQTLIASGNSPASPSETLSRGQPPNNSWLSLPVILTLLLLVALALIFALAKLMKQFRGSVN
ncbi:MAG: hypothetical protein ABIP14_08510 [Blastocatellia bacterium]